MPVDIRSQGRVAQMSDPGVIKEIKHVVAIPIMAYARTCHFVESQILEAINIDYIDESGVLIVVNDMYNINKQNLCIPFACDFQNLSEALRRISEGAPMINTKGEVGTDNVIEEVRDVRFLFG